MRGFGLVNVFKGQVRSADVLIGLGAGLAGAAALRWATNKLAESYPDLKIPKFVIDYSPALGGLGTALLVYALRDKVGALRARAGGMAVGAVAAGAAVIGYKLLQETEWGKKYLAGTGSAYGSLTPDPFHAHTSPSLEGITPDPLRLETNTFAGTSDSFMDAVAEMCDTEDETY